jgi:hypothetical protein
MCEEVERHTEVDAVMHTKERRGDACKRDLHRSPDTPENLLQLVEPPPPIWLRGAGKKAQSMVEKYGVKGVEALQLILAERVAKGWGAPSNAEFDEKKLEATIIVQDLFECLALKGENKETKSRFFRGYLA